MVSLSPLHKMNNPIIISRRILQTTTDAFNGVPETSPVAPAAAVSPDANVSTLSDPSKPFDSTGTKTLIILLSATAFACVTFFVCNLCCSRSGADSPPTRRLSGLDSTAVNSLPLIPYAEHGMIDDCPICLTEFRQEEAVKLIPYCGHVFHPTCLDAWLASHVTCPLCRSAADEELSLDIVAPDNCAAAAAERSDTWTRPDVGGVRRACSCSDLANQAVLQRSASF